MTEVPYIHRFGQTEPVEEGLVGRFDSSNDMWMVESEVGEVPPVSTSFPMAFVKTLTKRQPSDEDEL